MKIRQTTKREEEKFIKLFNKLLTMRLAKGFSIGYLPNKEIVIKKHKEVQSD